MNGHFHVGISQQLAHHVQDDALHGDLLREIVPYVVPTEVFDLADANKTIHTLFTCSVYRLTYKMGIPTRPARDTRKGLYTA
jgi:hypothetical protein